MNDKCCEEILEIEKTVKKAHKHKVGGAIPLQKYWDNVQAAVGRAKEKCKCK